MFCAFVEDAEFEIVDAHDEECEDAAGEEENADKMFVEDGCFFAWFFCHGVFGGFVKAEGDGG